MSAIFTIGYSTHSFEHFAVLLKRNGVTAVADVRSAPYSRYNPQYNREPLKAALESVGIAYSHVGDQLGAMRTEPEVYLPSGRVDFSRTWLTPAFREGIQRIRNGLQKYAIAMMCAERDPLTCHRNLLISRFLRDELQGLSHIRADGSLESHSELESRLLAECKLPEKDLFRSREQLIKLAYEMLAGEHAYHRDTDSDSPSEE